VAVVEHLRRYGIQAFDLPQLPTDDNFCYNRSMTLGNLCSLGRAPPV